MIEIERQEQIISPWVTLVTHVVNNDDGIKANYHSLKQADYVAILGVTEAGEIPLVQQYRPALTRYTWELPGGLLEEDENPKECALRELFEETGFESNNSEIALMGVLQPDTGRLENKLWCFFASNILLASNWKQEAGINIQMVNTQELINQSLSGKFDHALHIAVVGLAMMNGYLK